MVRRGRPPKEPKEELVFDIKDEGQYDSLYPDDMKIEESKPEVKEVVKKTERDYPVSDSIKTDILNRLIGIQNIATEWHEGKYEKIIMLAEECINMLKLRED